MVTIVWLWLTFVRCESSLNSHPVGIVRDETGNVDCHWITQEGERLTTSAVLTVT